MKRILVIQLHRFGDLIQTTPLFPGLKEKFPGCYLAVLAQKDFAEVLMGNPYINGLFLFDKGGGSKGTTEQGRSTEGIL